MSNKKISLLLFVLGIVLILGMILLEISTLESYHFNPAPYAIALTLGSIISIGLSITVHYFNAEVKKRRRAIIIISTICGLTAAFAVYSKMNHFFGASVEFILSFFFFSFSCLPLIVKARFDKRKHLFTQKQILLSFSDQINVSLILLSVVFKIMHWPGSQAMLIIGVSGFIISMILWNRSFSKEVSLRHDAEQKLKQAFGELEEKNKEILDSINYAQRIQHALLASDSILKKNLPEHFVLFNPKDVVSGDFYWACEAHGKFYFIIADSTGHGVPGAFMSLLNISFLNEGINEKKIKNPNEILDHVRKRLISSLAIEGSDEGGNDGMDCILMAFDKTNHKLEVCCAHNPLIIIRGSEIIEIAADKIPVGKSLKNEMPFTLQTIELMKGDMLFAFTDGFADQFGGPKGKKLKYKQLCETLIKNKELPMKQQHENLLSLFSNWKGNLEQVDDVLIIGIRQ